MLVSSRGDLRDLVQSQPELTDAQSGARTGLRLKRFLGSGGMATVFAAELDRSARYEGLAERTPRSVAVKLLHPAVQLQVSRMGGGDLLRREAAALERMMRRTPPCEFVVDYFGGGATDVEVAGLPVCRVPWLALELVDGGHAGTTLSERVEGALEGIDPVRALRLLRGLCEAVETLHEEEIIHRDLKPDNVLIVGAVDEETPKLTDCGIARVEGVDGTVAALTPAYAGPEQAFSVPTERNILVGPWTDVHALAAVAFFILGGETWCRGDGDSEWHRGRRRSLMTSAQLHPAFVMDGEAWLNQIDEVLRVAGSPRLPAAALAAAAGTPYETIALRAPSLAVGQPRTATAKDFASALLPILGRCATAWTARAAHRGKPATALRTTEIAPSEPAQLRYEVRGKMKGVAEGGCAAGCAVIQPDGRVLARFGDELTYLIDDRPMKVKVPREHQGAVAQAKRIVRGPGGGFAIVGETSVLLLKKGAFTLAPWPAGPAAPAGPTIAVLEEGRPFGVVCADRDDTYGGPSLWTSEDGSGWSPPRVLPLGGEPTAVASGPFGFVVAGGKAGRRGCAMFASLDGQNVVYAQGVHGRPPLSAAVCGSSREAWVAGEGFVVALERGEVREERVEGLERPVAMGLDHDGVPWLLASYALYRRHFDRQSPPLWIRVHERAKNEPPLIALGFVEHGVKLLDGLGGHVVLTRTEG